jgi:hypothetical protein
MNHTYPLVLHPVDLTDKWGFHDGDIMDPVLDDWILRSGWSEHLDVESNYDSAYFSSRVLLSECVARHIVRALPADLRSHVVRVYTVHNPFRLFADSVRIGVTDEDDETAEEALRQRLEQLDPVKLAQTDVDSICESLFPIRPRGWMAMYDALYLPSVRTDFLPPTQPSNPFDKWEVYYRLAPYVTQLATTHHDDEMLLAAEIVINDLSRIDVSVVANALDSARRVLR